VKSTTLIEKMQKMLQISFDLYLSLTLKLDTQLCRHCEVLGFRTEVAPVRKRSAFRQNQVGGVDAR